MPFKKNQVPWNFKDIRGQKFGRLTVLSHAGSYLWKYGAKDSLWLCECECGTKKTISRSVLKQSRSCGCFYRETRRLKKTKWKLRLTVGEGAKRLVIKTYKRAARIRKKEWSLLRGEFFELISRDCHYCGRPPSNAKITGRFSGGIKWNGIDRVDNDLGYHLGNVVPCCHVCNHAKRDMPQHAFLAWVQAAFSHCADRGMIHNTQAA